MAILGSRPSDRCVVASRADHPAALKKKTPHRGVATGTERDYFGGAALSFLAHRREGNAFPYRVREILGSKVMGEITLK